MTQIEIRMNNIMHMLLFACISQEFSWVCFHLVKLLEENCGCVDEKLGPRFNLSVSIFKVAMRVLALRCAAVEFVAVLNRFSNTFCGSGLLSISSRIDRPQ